MKQYLITIFSCMLMLSGTGWVYAQNDPSQKDVHRLTNLPHVYINTFSGNGIYSTTEYVYARMWYVDEEDNVQFYDSLQIRGRGNATWGLAKRPYKLKFQKKEKLLGKGYANARKWTLLANHGDKTLIRNAVTSLMGERAGLKFNPAAKFVDLTLNDRYVGNYQISDQVEVRPHRVNIAEQEYPLAEGADITGGYLLEGDGSGEFHTNTYWSDEAKRNLPPDGFTTTRGNVPVRIHYPDAEDLDRTQVAYIRQFVNRFDQRLFASNYDDPVEGYRPLVDSVSLANWYICSELSANVDAFWSTYFYKEQADDRLFWGPLWDYDIAYNNDNRERVGKGCNTTLQLIADVGYGNVRNWVVRMWRDPWFQKLVYRRYTELINGGMEDYLNQKIDSLVQLIDESVQLNYKRWRIDTQTLRELVLYSTYDEYVSDLREFLAVHIPYLKEAFAKKAGIEDGPGPAPKVPDFDAKKNVCYTISNSGSGTFVDVNLETEAVCANSLDEESKSQQWFITPLKNGYMFITNRATGYALNDPTEGEPTATTLTGTQLNTVPADSLDLRQQWDVVKQEQGRYNLVNRFSEHAANLSGGGTENGTAVLSYTSDERNSTSNNRLWVIEEARDQNGNVIEGLDEMVDYALAYDPQSGRIHFGADNLSAFNFPVRVYDQLGRLVVTFQASEGASLSHLPRGLYIVSWYAQKRQKSVKLVR